MISLSLREEVSKIDQNALISFMAKQAQPQDRTSWSIRSAHMLHVQASSTQSRKATKSSYFDRNQPVGSHRRTRQHQSEEGLYATCEIPSGCSLWKGISGQTNQLARS